jgi:phospholipid transport system substrate-binding protein
MEIPKGEAVPFIYRMHQTDGSWKVVDVFLNGYVSELATRRSDFSATLARGGPSGLVKQIDALSDKLMAGG